MFFDGWSGVWRVLVHGVAAYASLVVLLRVSGKRTLTKLNAFDFVVTVALGSSLATVLLSRDTPVVEGLIAFALLIGLQWGVAFLEARSSTVRTLVKSEPTLLFHRGRFLHAQLRRERLSAEEVRAVVREQGYASLDDVEAVVLETAGEISVLSKVAHGPRSTLAGVRRPDEAPEPG